MNGDSHDGSIHDFLVERYRRFRTESFPARQDLFEELAQGQNPRVLFITCSDSRVVPSLILAGDPGDVFECQIVGNIVPAYGDSFGGVSATLEYAVTVLKVQAIIVCGHSDCGAMKVLRDPSGFKDLTAIALWLRHSDAATRIAREACAGLSEDEALRLLTRENVIAQIDNMRTHPAVAAGRRRGLEVFGWMYDIKTGAVEAYDEKTRTFVPLAGRTLDTPKP
ncbi:MAG: carbonic anhydrase [Candidatus Eremiobacteraeota bacterium]|nr:carbonic anhydrase [Candidatus Eremiobacteraeota bacterium]